MPTAMRIPTLLAANVAVISLLGLTSAAPPLHAADATFTVVEQDIDDLKAVFANVRSKDRIEARVRTPGTVVSLQIDEGADVKPGQLLATVADPKIALKIKGLDAQIIGLESRLATVTLDYERAEQLRQRGVTPQARVDQLKSTLDVATNELKATRAERQISEEQAIEGQVLAPAGGRILRVPFTEGSVVMAGESIATIAANAYLLRLELPERHARFIRPGDVVKVGARGLSAKESVIGEGRITQVYPELQGGRVLADAEAPSLGDYFVGERALVWISAGKRRTYVVPDAFVFRRFGLDYVRLAGKDGKSSDVVIQLGARLAAPAGSASHEVLSGVRTGDVLARPVASQ